MGPRVAIVAILAFASASRAQGDDVKARADAAYSEGRRLYDLREWDRAIKKFKEAYELRPDAPSLFNIAQSYRLKGDCGEALGFYRTYKRNYPSAANIGVVDKFITELEPCAKSKPAAPEEPQPVAPAAPIEPERAAEPAPPAPAPAPAHPGRTQRIVGLSLVGGGAIVVGVGFYFGLEAQARAREAETNGWSLELEQRGRAADRNAIIGWVAGGATIIAGGVVYWLGRRAGAEHVAIVPRGDGATMVWSCDF